MVACVFVLFVPRLSFSLAGDTEYVHGGHVAEPRGHDADAVHGAASPAAATVPDVQPRGAADRCELLSCACPRPIVSFLPLQPRFGSTDTLCWLGPPSFFSSEARGPIRKTQETIRVGLSPLILTSAPRLMFSAAMRHVLAVCLHLVFLIASLLSSPDPNTVWHPYRHGSKLRRTRRRT